MNLYSTMQKWLMFAGFIVFLMCCALMPATVSASRLCSCVCSGRLGVTDAGTTCSQDSECSQAVCTRVCTRAGVATPVTSAGTCAAENGAPTGQAPTPTGAGAAARKFCSFQCVTATNPQGTPVTPDISISCTADTECATACDARCRVPSNATTNGNGFPAAQGTGLVCYRNPSNNPPVVPKCLPSGQSSNPSGAGSVPASSGGNRQTANTAMELPNPVGTTNLVDLLGRVVKAFLGILGALALMWMTWGGVLWMTAEESKRTEDAKVIMKNAALGIVLLFFAYGLASSFLGIFSEVASNAAPAGTRPPSQPRPRSTPTR